MTAWFVVTVLGVIGFAGNVSGTTSYGIVRGRWLARHARMADMLSQSSGNSPARIMPASEMSASQRNQTFDATIQQLNRVITQVNALTNDAMQQETDLASLKDRIVQREDADIAHGIWHLQQTERTLWQRLRWLLTGGR